MTPHAPAPGAEPVGALSRRREAPRCPLLRVSAERSASPAWPGFPAGLCRCRGAGGSAGSLPARSAAPSVIHWGGPKKKKKKSPRPQSGVQARAICGSGISCRLMISCTAGASGKSEAVPASGSGPNRSGAGSGWGGAARGGGLRSRLGSLGFFPPLPRVFPPLRGGRGEEGALGGLAAPRVSWSESPRGVG